MKCTNCGFEFEEGIFCPECGTKQEAEVTHREEETEKTGESVKSVESVQQKQTEKTVAVSKLENEENIKINNLKKGLEKIKVQAERKKLIEGYDASFETEGAKKRYAALCEKINQPAPKLEENHEKICKYSLFAFVISFVLICVAEGDLAFVMAFIWLASILGLIVYGILKVKITIASRSKGHYLNIKDI